MLYDARRLRPPLRLLGLHAHPWVTVLLVICVLVVVVVIARHRR